MQTDSDMRLTKDATVLTSYACLTYKKYNTHDFALNDKRHSLYQILQRTNSIRRPRFPFFDIPLVQIESQSDTFISGAPIVLKANARIRYFKK
jgi:hypothetical protein